MVTPLVRASPFVTTLPYPIQWYFKAVAGSGAFTLFPWVGFLLLGAVIGFWLDGTRTEDDERRVMRVMTVVGPVIAVGGYLSTYLPTVYAGHTFWTGSPTYFFVRIGVLITAIPIAYAWNALFRGWSPLRDLGVASLFVYWIHVEMVYGVVSFWIHKALTFEQAVVSYIAFTLFLYGLVKLKDRIVRDPASPQPQTLAPSPWRMSRWLCLRPHRRCTGIRQKQVSLPLRSMRGILITAGTTKSWRKALALRTSWTRQESRQKRVEIMGDWPLQFASSVNGIIPDGQIHE